MGAGKHQEGPATMRESCSCGADIRASYKRVKEWRKVHLHDMGDETNGPEGATSQAELSHQDDWAENRIGFRPN